MSKVSIEVNDMIILGDIVFVITMLDFSNGDGAFKHFKNQKDAELWLDRNRDKETDQGLN